MNEVGFLAALKAESVSFKNFRPYRHFTTVSGAGPKAAEKGAYKLLDDGVSALVSWGCCAALDPTLKPGDLILPDRLIAEDGSVFIADPQWIEAIKQTLSGEIKVHAGSLLESSRIITQASEKKQLFQSTQAVALDMESAALARVAKATLTPFIAIRVIVDPASMDLADSVLIAMDERGEVDALKVLTHALKHPKELLSLPLLGLHFNRAMKTLKDVAKQAIVPLISPPFLAK